MTSSNRRAQTVPGTNPGSYAPHMTGEASDVTLDAPASVEAIQAGPPAPIQAGEHWVSARDLTHGTVVIVDGEPRTVDVSWPVSATEVGVEFESYDREPDGTPSGYLFRTFGIDEYFRKPVPDGTVYEATQFAQEYCHAAGGARPGMCHPAAWNVQERFGWPIVSGEREDRRHHWNQMPDGRYFDPTAAQFDGHAGPLVTDADDPRYTARTDSNDDQTADRS